MADTYWAEREGARWDVYGKQRGWMAQADTEDDARLIVAGLEALQDKPAAVPAEKRIDDPASLSLEEGYEAAAYVRGWNECRAAMLAAMREGE